MNCPECGKKSKVIDTRQRDNGKYGYIPEGITHRRRQCLYCECRFVSYELLESEYRLLKSKGYLNALIKVREMAEDMVTYEAKKICEIV